MLKEIRIEKEMTLRELSFKAGVSASFLSLVENNKRNLSITKAKKIGEILKVDWKSLY